MTRKEARNLIKTKAPNLYHGTALVLLSLLTDSCCGPEGTREITFKRITLMGWAHIGSEQLTRHLNSFREYGLLTYNAVGNKITVFLNLLPLIALPKSKTLKDVKADRATKAREVRAEKYDLQMAYAEEYF